MIYHYTDVHGLLGILENGELWLSDQRFLNDSTEGGDAYEFLKQALQRSRGGINVDGFKAVSGFMIHRSWASFTFNTYLASFSEPDILSQWRGYCPFEGGYCIGFDENLLQATHPSVSQSKCIYQDSDKLESWLAIIDQAISFYQAHGTLDYQQAQSKIGVLHTDLQTLAALSVKVGNEYLLQKNKHFIEEKEHRIFYTLSNQSSAENDLVPRYRCRKSYLHPYVVLENIQHCVKEIIVGPAPNIQRNIAALQDFIRKRNLPIKYRPSEIPLQV